MNRDWRDFKAIHSNLEGARESFEDACELLFRKVYPNKHVSKVQVKHGDGGIDVFIGEFGIEPITVIQCKFFLDSFSDSQKTQIKSSFNTAFNNKKFELKEWILCMPRSIDIDENSWWFKWKHNKIKEISKDNEFIKLINGNELISLMKKHEVYNEVFEIEVSRKIDEIHQTIVGKKLVRKTENNKTILFNNYTIECEPYYFERNEDTIFLQNLKLSNIWIYGRSGVGKTALIRRNLIQQNICYLFCDISSVDIVSSDDILEEIIYFIEDKYEINRHNNESNKIKIISKLLNELPPKQFVVVIDELSLNNNDLMKDIASSLNRLVTYYNNLLSNEDLRFVVSTINDPKLMLHNKTKASDYFLFLDCDHWDGSLKELSDLLINELGLNIGTEERDRIVVESKNSPRLLKKILKKIVVFGDVSPNKISLAISQAKQESL